MRREKIREAIEDIIIEVQNTIMRDTIRCGNCRPNDTTIFKLMVRDTSGFQFEMEQNVFY